MFRISPYKYNLYRQCPAAYKFTYIDGIANEYKKPKPYLTMGSHVHNALKDLYDKIQPEKRNYHALESLLRIRWPENRKGFANTKEERTYGIEALQMLRLFAHKMDIQKTPLLLEDYYDADINDRIILLGRIDRVDEEGQGVHVIDYKTGRSNDSDDWKFQVLAYALIVSRSLKKPVIKASCLYLRNFEWKSVKPTEKDYASLIIDLDKQVSIIQSDKIFEAQTGKHCKFCDFRSICVKKDEIVV